MGMKEKEYNKHTKNGESIHVYIPYGPYWDMIPYLTRRLYENLDQIKFMTSI